MGLRDLFRKAKLVNQPREKQPVMTINVLPNGQYEIVPSEGVELLTMRRVLLECTEIICSKINALETGSVINQLLSQLLPQYLDAAQRRPGAQKNGNGDDSATREAKKEAST